MSNFYKIGSKIELFLKPLVAGWWLWVLLIFLLLCFLFLQINDFNRADYSLDIGEMMKFCVFFVVFFVILFFGERNLRFRKILEFVQHCVTTFIFNYGFVSTVTISSYYLAITLDFIDLNPDKDHIQKGLGLILIIFLTLIVTFSFSPTSLIVKGYMQRYDDKWKTYHHHYVYIFPLFMLGLSSMWLIWVEYKGINFPFLAKEYIKVITQTKIVLGALVVHFFTFLLSAYFLEKKCIEQ